MASAAPLRTFNNRVPSVKIRYSPRRSPFYREAEILGNYYNPRRAKTIYLLNEVPADILRWVVNTDASTKALPLSTQRNRLRRRWNAAVIDALKRQGLDSKGRRIDADQTIVKHQGGDAPNTTAPPVPTPFLKGTMEVVVYDGYGFEENATTLAEQSDQIVQSLLRTRDSTV